MTQKSESESKREGEAPGNGAAHEISEDRVARKRQRLLARVAGDVAAGVVTAPSKSATSAKAVAEISVDIAEAILQRIGI